MSEFPKTKIVCTLGPSTDSEERIEQLIESGMNVARLNLSHGELSQHHELFTRIRNVAERMGKPTGILVDVPGAKYRIGPLEPTEVDLENDDVITLTSRDLVGSPDIASVSPPGIHLDVEVDQKVLIDDGRITLRVRAIRDKDVECVVAAGGKLTKGRGVTAPGSTRSRPFVGQKAMEALNFAGEMGADFVALSMVTQPEDVIWARDILQSSGWEGMIISKIERPKALDNFDAILSASDGIMVARGDLGVQVRLARVPLIQKDLILRCNIAGKPVITATQMLESMCQSSLPTRAEVTDVANAVFDGTDAIMLSGETSVGAYPIQAVKIMAEVALEAEAGLNYESILSQKRKFRENQTDDAISYAAVRTAGQLDAKLIIAFTETGGTAGRVSKYRPSGRILALTSQEQVCRLLTLRWGVSPMVITPPQSIEGFFVEGARKALSVMNLSPGDLTVLVAGLPIGVKGGTNLLRVLSLPESVD